jgi:quercetin dioxygenase-like cupin family protein
MIQKLVEGLQPVDEGSFQYFDLVKGYEITLNFVKAGSQLPDHKHDQTVFSYVLAGEFQVTDKNGTHALKKGDWIRIPKGEEHAVIAKVETTLLEFWQK